MLKSKAQGRGRAVRWLCCTLLGAVAALVNPALACSSEDPEPQWQFDQADMRAAVEGSYVLQDAENRAILIEVKQAPTATQQAASGLHLQCGNVERSFVAPAGACETVYESKLPVTATIDSTSPVVVSGTYSGVFTSDGLVLSFGELRLDLGAAEALVGAFTQGSFSHWSKTGSASVPVMLQSTETGSADAE